MIRNLLIFGFLIHSTLALSLGIFEAKHLKPVIDFTLQLGQKYGPKNVLMVYDIDNTLLAMDRDLGSDQWFNWQKSLIDSGNTTYAVATDFPGLLNVQSKLFQYLSMHAVQRNTAELVYGLQNQGIKSILLTSRGNENREPTIRELWRNKMDFTRSQIGNGFIKTYYPYDPRSPEQVGITREELVNWGIADKTPQLVSYYNGVYMTAGQHKGAMLRALLGLLKQNYRAIVFVDDHAHHTKNMYNAFVSKNVDINSFRYSFEDQRVIQFNQSNKANAIQDWEKFQAVMKP